MIFQSTAPTLMCLISQMETAVELSSLFLSRIDLAVLLFVLIIGIIGIFSGAIRQIANLVGLVVAYFLARPVGTRLSPLAAELTGLPLFFLTLTLCLVAFFAVYALTYFLLRMLLKQCLPEGEHGFMNRMGGFLLGSIKALLLTFVLLSGVVLIESTIAALWEGFSEEAKISRAYGFVRENSVFARISQFETLQTVIQANGNRGDPRTMAALEQLTRDPNLVALTKDPRISSIAHDPTIQKAIAQGNYAALFSNKKILGALNDPELFDHLGKVRTTLGLSLVPGTVPANPKDSKVGGGSLSLSLSEEKAADVAQRSRSEEIEAMQGE